MVNINNVFQSDYLKAADLNDAPALVTVKSWNMETMTDDTQKICLHFHEMEKGMLLNKTNANNIAGFLGPETDHWIGKKVVLVSAMVDFQGKSVEAIRVRAPKSGNAAARAMPQNIQQGPPPGHPAALDDEVPF